MKTYCVVLPVYNNAATVGDVIKRILIQTRDLLVVDDGSTDIDLPALCKSLGVECAHHEVNRGKGAALRTAIHILKDRPYEYMIALDADGQHYPEDIPSFLCNSFCLPLKLRPGGELAFTQHYNHLPLLSFIMCWSLYQACYM